MRTTRWAACAISLLLPAPLTWSAGAAPGPWADGLSIAGKDSIVVSMRSILHTVTRVLRLNGLYTQTGNTIFDATDVGSHVIWAPSRKCADLPPS